MQIYTRFQQSNYLVICLTICYNLTLTVTVYNSDYSKLPHIESMSSVIVITFLCMLLTNDILLVLFYDLPELIYINLINFVFSSFSCNKYYSSIFEAHTVLVTPQRFQMSTSDHRRTTSISVKL